MARKNSLNSTGADRAFFIQPDEQYRLLVENSIDLLWRMDPQFRFTYVSRSVRQFGYEPEEWIGRCCRDFMPVEDREERRRFHEQLSDNPQKHTYRARLLRKDGAVAWVEVAISCVMENGRLSAIEGITRDISRRKQMEDDLRQERDFTAAVIDTTAALVIVLDTEGRTVSFNRQCERVTGYSLDELKGVPFWDILLPDEEISEVKNVFHDLKAGKAAMNVENHWFTKSGDRRLISWSNTLLNDPDGSTRFIIGTGIDITDRTRAEEALRANESFLNTVFEGTQDGLCVVDSDMNVLRVNSAFGRWFPNAASSPGSKCYEVFYGRSRVCSNCPTLLAIQTGKSQIQVVPMGDPREPRGWCELYSHPLFDSNGRTCGAVEYVRDITERKQAEARARIQTMAVNATSDQIVIINAQGQIEFVNPAFERETGYNFDEAAGKTLRLLDSGEHPDEFYEHIWEITNSGQNWQGEITNRRKDGSLYIEDMSITPVKDDSGRIEYFIAIKRNVTEKKMHERKLDHMAHHDQLTGLPNRLLFSDRLNQSLLQAKREGRSIAVMFIDLDRFKPVNDNLGHKVGDLLLKEAARRLRKAIREVDTISRVGGDEFTVIVGDITGTDDAESVASRILDALSTPFHIQGHEIIIGASIGISVYPSDGDDTETLVRNADSAMYCAKESGRNNYKLYTTALGEAALERMALENDLRRSLDDGELLVHYQPRVEISSGRILGAEALVRWRHPELGMVPPNRFIPAAEETGLIAEITRFVLMQACNQSRIWGSQGLPVMDVAVNISSRLLQQDCLPSIVKQVLDETGLPPARLSLEFSESMLMRNMERAVSVLGQLKKIGIRISVDDFGTGQISLNHLRRFPIDCLKIDRSLVKEINRNAEEASMVEAMIAMAHGLRLQVIAEGVETLEQLKLLQELTCDEIQGYFISPPVPAESLAEHYRTNYETTEAIHQLIISS